MSDRYEAGLEIRKAVLGDEYVESSLTRNAGKDGEALQRQVTEHVWGDLWTRPGLDRRSRSLVNLGMLIALGQHHELAAHVRGALANGLGRDEIVEVVLHATVYVGAPSGLAAMRVVQEVLEAELGERD
jgi:4-carboxymuconolactone decarboxylase